jgi:hypothetical protein
MITRRKARGVLHVLSPKSPLDFNTNGEPGKAAGGASAVTLSVRL